MAVLPLCLLAPSTELAHSKFSKRGSAWMFTTTALICQACYVRHCTELVLSELIEPSQAPLETAANIPHQTAGPTGQGFVSFVLVAAYRQSREM